MTAVQQWWLGSQASTTAHSGPPPLSFDFTANFTGTGALASYTPDVAAPGSWLLSDGILSGGFLTLGPSITSGSAYWRFTSQGDVPNQIVMTMLGQFGPTTGGVNNRLYMAIVRPDGEGTTLFSVGMGHPGGGGASTEIAVATPDGVDDGVFSHVMSDNTPYTLVATLTPTSMVVTVNGVGVFSSTFATQPLHIGSIYVTRENPADAETCKIDSLVLVAT